ncbi:MAG: NAD(P)/FAD-dependent oxidoreductase [Candidatus Nitrosocosmicus sp.]
MTKTIDKLRIDFSFRREVFFVVLGAIAGSVLMMLPDTIYGIISQGNYHTVWIIFGHVIGVYSQYTILAGILIHFVTALSIGLVLGVFLYKSGLLEISKPVNGLLYGLFTGAVVFLLWAIPVQQLILNPETSRTMVSMNPMVTEQQVLENINKNLIIALVQSFVRNLIFGIMLGLVSSYLTIKLGKRFRCPRCNISFSRVDLINKHLSQIHCEKIPQIKIVILGGGFGGIEALKKLQRDFENEVRVDITIVNKENFFLFTPMLHEVVSGMIETSHIAVPIRSFCKRARFVEAEVEKIDLENKTILLRNKVIGGRIQNNNNKNDENNISNAEYIDPYNHFKIDYDYLLFGLGGKTNYHGNKELKDVTYSMKNLEDANLIRSHIISSLEQADILADSNPIEFQRKKNLIRYLVVGGGFSGVETVGEINEFIRECVKTYYHNIDISDIEIILVNSGSRIIPEMDERLGAFALEQLKKKGVNIILSQKVREIQRGSSITKSKKSDVVKVTAVDKTPLAMLYSITNNPSHHEIIDETSLYVNLGYKSSIPTYTVIWTAGVMPENVIQSINLDKDRKGRLLTNDFLQVTETENIFAVGDCASIIDPQTGLPCPPTAQHAIRQGEIAGKNIASLVRYELTQKYTLLERFDYKTRGMMATIGKRNGVGVIFGIKVLGIVAWFIWRAFYLNKIPSRANKFRVIVDWTTDTLFGRDIARLKTPIGLVRKK